MKRIRTLLAVAIGAMALTASLGASVASASGISFAQYPATVKGTALSEHVFQLSGNRTVTCTMPTFESYAAGPSETLAATLAPGECSSSFEGKVNLKLNGCKFIYHPAVGEGSFDIGPAGCGPITLEGTYCTRSFPAQSGLAASFTNQAGTPSTVKVTENASGVNYTVTKGTVGLCGTSGAATLIGSWQLSAVNQTGTPINSEVVAGTGFYLTGKASGEPASQPKFEAEKYPSTITGFQDPYSKQVLTIGGNRELRCQEVNARSTITAASSQLALGMEYAGCAIVTAEVEFPTTVTMNGCGFVLKALNVGPPYSGSLDVACGKEGEAVELNSVFSGGSPQCTFRIAPQAGLTGIGLKNVGSGNARGVTATFGLSGIAVTRAKGTFGSCGPVNQSASYAGATTFHGVS